MTFYLDFCVMQDLTTRRTIRLGWQSNGFYYLTINRSPPSSNTIHHTSNLWHKRLGHPSTTPLQLLSKTIPDISFNSHTFCDVCPLAKQFRLPFSNSSISSHEPFDLILCDIWGLYKIHFYSRARYFFNYCG